VSGIIMFSRFAGHSDSPQCPAILCFHDLPDTRPLLHVRQLSHFCICRTLDLSSVSGNCPISASAGHSGYPLCPAIPGFHNLLVTPTLRNVRQYYVFTICRSTRLSAMSCNTMLSRSAGHSTSPPCPALLCFHDLPDTRPLLRVRQLSHFRICRTRDLSSMSGNCPISAFADHSGSPPCSAILCFHYLPDTPASRHARQYYVFTIRRTLDLSAMSENTIFSQSAGHSDIKDVIKKLLTLLG